MSGSQSHKSSYFRRNDHPENESFLANLLQATMKMTLFTRKFNIAYLFSESVVKSSHLTIYIHSFSLLHLPCKVGK